MAYIAANKSHTSDQQSRFIQDSEALLRKIANIKRGAITVQHQQAMSAGKPSINAKHAYPDGTHYTMYKGSHKPNSKETLHRWDRDERKLSATPAYCKPD